MEGKFPNGLKSSMNLAGLGPTKLAKLTGYTKQDISRWAKGERKLLGPAAERIAPFLSTTPESLVFPDRHQPHQIPLLSWVSAGRLAEPDGVVPADVKEFVITNDLPPGDWIALQVDGDSMDWIAPHGAIIIVNRHDKHLIDGQFYVFALPEGASTFKRFRKGDPPRLQPYSHNPDHETIYPSDGMKVVGRVRRVIFDPK